MADELGPSFLRDVLRVVKLRNMMRNPRMYSKATREAGLKELRALEAKLGLDESYANGYNGGKVATDDLTVA